MDERLLASLDVDSIRRSDLLYYLQPAELQQLLLRHLSPEESIVVLTEAYQKALFIGDRYHQNIFWWFISFIRRLFLTDQRRVGGCYNDDTSDSASASASTSTSTSGRYYDRCCDNSNNNNNNNNNKSNNSNARSTYSNDNDHADKYSPATPLPEQPCCQLCYEDHKPSRRFTCRVCTEPKLLCSRCWIRIHVPSNRKCPFCKTWDLPAPLLVIPPPLTPKPHKMDS